ncbi:MAG TPA: S1/P1 nuclease, partial [Phenylobacterium sp.]|nr:S1/P1 nuclease [Phenylobacterium sp.]
WLLHIVGDLHQPLHAAERFSAAWPDGDGGGSRPYLLDPLTGEPIALHWLWDDSVNRSGVAADVDRRAREIEAAHPRSALAELQTTSPPEALARRAHDESYALARSLAYGAEPPTGRRPEDAPPAPQPYWYAVRAAAEVRVAIAGYRIADLVIAALDPAP